MVWFSLCIIPLRCRENDGMAPSIPNWAVWTWWFSSHTLYLFAKRLAEAQNQSEASDVQSTVVKHLTSYSDSQRESSHSGRVHNRSLHWLSYPIVTVVHLNLLIRMECIFLYSLAFSQFYLLLLVSNVTSCNCAEANRMSVVCLSFIKASLLVFIFLRTQQLLCRWSYSIM